MMGKPASTLSIALIVSYVLVLVGVIVWVVCQILSQVEEPYVCGIQIEEPHACGAQIEFLGLALIVLGVCLAVALFLVDLLKVIPFNLKIEKGGGG